MKKKIYLGFFLLVFTAVSCKKELNVGNPNAPTLDQNVTDLNGLIAFAKGGVYFNGFRDGLGWLGDSYFNLPWTYHELMGDNLVGGEGSNNQTTTMGVPDYIIKDDGTKLENSSPQVSIIRTFNNRSATGEANNALYYEWLAMYNLNAAMNTALAEADKLSTDGKLNDNQLKTIQAWAHYWKGFAYGAIGTMYYGGVLVDEIFGSSSDFVSHTDMIAASDAQYDMAASLLPASVNSDYTNVLGNLIPAHCQVGKGGILTPDEWKATINTMKARNILLNHLSPFVNGNPSASISGASISPMGAAEWASVKSLTDGGIGADDLVFTGRTVETNSFFSATGGSVAAYVTGKNTVTGEKVSERLIQNFDPADNRLITNFNTATNFTNAYSFSTRWSLQDGHGTTWPNDVYAYGTRDVGAYELYISGSYEENALMNAEARIQSGDIDGGVAIVNAVRAEMGAGLPALPNGLTLAQALTALVSERRVALAFRGLSFFDLRRWGWTYDISKGGGAYNQIFVYSGSSGLEVNTHATVSYNYMDYWDVPGDETELNPAMSGTEFLKNPNY
ncbi:MAG: RagB/SusD family nutrient uptake outer membrane protein [Bacteroidota bacterium]